MKKLINILVFVIFLILLLSYQIALSEENTNINLNLNKFHKDNLLADLPTDFPPITITTLNNPSSGKVFLANYGTGYGFYIIILDSSGAVYKYKNIPLPALDFKMHSNGLLSYPQIITGNPQLGSAEVIWKIIDSSFNDIDSIVCGNGFMADLHEFHILPNGNYLLMSYYELPIDMSKVIPGGIPNARVVHSLIQELDANKNVIFQWKAQDYIPITDAYINFLGQMIVPSHINALELDYDGNLLVSSRQLSEITKINRNTGEIIWRLGGKKNQFTFIDENEENAPNYFSMMHCIRRLPNGNIILFDNGNQHKPPYSRAVEYELDEVNKTAKLVWEWRHTPDIFSASMASVQRLDSGETLIGWGGPLKSGEPSITEINKDGEVTFELSLPDGTTNYRAYKYQLDKCKLIASVIQRELFDGDERTFNDKDKITNVRVVIETIKSIWVYNRINVERYDCPPLNPRFSNKAPLVFPYRWVITPMDVLQFKGDFYFKLDHIKGLWDFKKAKIYYRDTAGSGEFKLLPSTYNPETNELKVNITKFGEFIIGIPEEVTIPPIPLLVAPRDKEKINNKIPVRIEWSPLGYCTASHLLIADDINFENIIVDTNTKLCYYIFYNYNSDKTYYWKVQTQNEAGYSEWSAIRSFIPVNPFIQISYPNGGEIFYKDSSFIIRWQKNLLPNEYVKILLLHNNDIIAIIKDSLLSATGAFKWKVSNTYESDSNYRIKIININNEDIASISDGFFAIKDGITSVEDDYKSNNLIQNLLSYPNPAQGNVSIEFSLTRGTDVIINIYDIAGKLVTELENNYLNEGLHSYLWKTDGLASGRYICKIKALNTILLLNISIEK